MIIIGLMITHLKYVILILPIQHMFLEATKLELYTNKRLTFKVAQYNTVDDLLDIN